MVGRLDGSGFMMTVPFGLKQFAGPPACYHVQLGPCCLNAGVYILVW
jgi:hypothetical protein